MADTLKQIVIDAGELIRHAHLTAEDISDKGGCTNFVTTLDGTYEFKLFSKKC